jgi:CheY-like chemotaxis protein
MALLKTVLVVDDEEVVCQVCATLVQQLGFRTITAADGEEGLMVFKRHADEIGCVLLDLTMPRMDGISTFREMKRLRPDIPVILCSGYDEQDATQHFTNEGLAGFLQKPYSLQDLKNKIEPVLTGWATIIT